MVISTCLDISKSSDEGGSNLNKLTLRIRNNNSGNNNNNYYDLNNFNAKRAENQFQKVRLWIYDEKLNWLFS